MKLNLLPTYVSKERASRGALILSILMVVASIAGCLALIFISQDTLRANKAAVEEMQPRAKAAVDTAAQAETIIAQAGQIIRNISLAEAMIGHNRKYPDFYDEFFRYIPPFFRLSSITVVPIDAEQVNVSMTGTIGSYQRYADLMLALMRNPDAMSIGRSGFVSVDPVVPGVTPDDPTPGARRPGEAIPPAGVTDRIAFLSAQAAANAIPTAPGFGQPDEVPRGALPEASLIGVSMVVRGQLQTPDPRATLQAAAMAPAAAAPFGGPPRVGGPGGAGPGFGFGPPGGVAGGEEDF